MRNLLLLILVGLVVYTIIDVVQSDREDRSGVPAPLWILIIVALPVVGSIGWLALSRSVRRGRGGGGPGGGRRGGGGGIRPPAPTQGPRRPGGPVAPDDDPEFLWRLAQQQREQRGNAPDQGTDGPGHRDPGTPGHDGDHDTSGPRVDP